jgi:signal transduction histidine kinase
MKSKIRFHILFIFQVVWIVTVLLMVGWWHHLVTTQADRIATLESETGIYETQILEQRAKTQRMIFWESSAFFLLILSSGGALLWLYWRDLRRSRGIQAFFASFSHELRTPLTSIRLQAESLHEELSPHQSSTQGDLLSRLLEDTQRLENQVETSLELARLEGGGPLLLQSIHLDTWLKEFLYLQSQIDESKVHLVSEIEDARIQGDYSALQMILRNLIENSIRHGGKIVGKVSDLEISLKIAKKGKMTCLWYEDNGTGVQGDSKKLGKLFYKGERSHGAGVGLYLVQKLITSMGGFIHFYASSHTASGFKAELCFLPGGDSNE